MGLPYLKHDVIASDVYMLGVKSTEAFTIYFIFYSYCFEHTVFSIPKDIALEKASDFTDDVDSIINILVKRRFIVVSDNDITVIGAPERVQNAIEYSTRYANNQKNYRERLKNKNNKEQSKTDDEQPDPGIIPTQDSPAVDYKAIVQSWNSKYPMNDIQLKTSYSRLKSNSDWDPSSIADAMVFIHTNPTIKNRVLCDWYEAGFFKTGYKFDLKTINSHFESKSKKNKKSVDETGCGVNLKEQGWPEKEMDFIDIKKLSSKNKKVEEETDPLLTKMLENGGSL
jgi:hypothetical protein